MVDDDGLPQPNDEDQGEHPEENGLSQPLLRQRVIPACTHQRLLDRDAPFSQSRGRWNIRHESRQALRRRTTNNAVSRNAKYAWDHWFYALAYKQTSLLMAILFLSYASVIIMYAAIYLALSKFGKSTEMDPDSGEMKTKPFCDMDIKTFTQSLYFSLSTMTATGYGVSDYWFGKCWTPFILVLFQVFTAICFDAVAVGLLFHRFSRGHKRGKTVLFSSHAVVVQKSNGSPCLAFRLAELRSHTLLSTTLRCFCIRHDRSGGGGGAEQQYTDYFVTRPMTTIGGENILMRLPQIVYHELNASSPLQPPAGWFDADGHVRRADEFKEFWKDRSAEVVVVVEGTDELTGTTIQARHSYTVEDILWNQRFVSCIDATAMVDFATFHETEPVSDDFVMQL